MRAQARTEEKSAFTFIQPLLLFIFKGSAVALILCFSGIYPPKHVTPARERNQDTSRQPSRSGSIPALLPKPPLTPLVKLVGKVYSLKCRSGWSTVQQHSHINTTASLFFLLPEHKHA